MFLGAFNVSSTLLFNTGIDTFAIIIIFIVYCNGSRITAKSYGQRLFRKTQLSLAALLVTDIIMWQINGVPGRAMSIAGWADNIIYFMFMPYVTINWFQYGWYRVYKMPLPKKIRLLSCTIPVILLILCDIASPWLKLVFYIDEKNCYHRGPLTVVFSAFFMLYVFFTSIIALRKYHRTDLTSDKNECLAISSFIVGPLIGGIIQTLFYGCSLSAPAGAFSILLVYLNLQNREISLDALTQLNNRASLDKYLQACFASDKKESIALIIFDVNFFKSINDTYGHLSGDEALSRLSVTLKTTFADTDAFLARYGGDEFAAVMRNCSKPAVEKEITRVKAALEAYNELKSNSVPISVSAGYGFYPEPGIQNAKDLFSKADHSMYVNKREYHERETALDGR